MAQAQPPAAAPTFNPLPPWLATAATTGATFLEDYGWYVLGGIALVSYVAPAMASRVRESRGEAGYQVASASDDAVKKARARQQQKSNADAAANAERKRVRDEEKKAAALAENGGVEEDLAMGITRKGKAKKKAGYGMLSCYAAVCCAAILTCECNAEDMFDGSSSWRSGSAGYGGGAVQRIQPSCEGGS